MCNFESIKRKYHESEIVTNDIIDETLESINSFLKTKISKYGSEATLEIEYEIDYHDFHSYYLDIDDEHVSNFIDGEYLGDVKNFFEQKIKEYGASKILNSHGRNNSLRIYIQYPCIEPIEIFEKRVSDEKIKETNRIERLIEDKKEEIKRLQKHLDILSSM